MERHSATLIPHFFYVLALNGLFQVTGVLQHVRQRRTRMEPIIYVLTHHGAALFCAVKLSFVVYRHFLTL